MLATITTEVNVTQTQAEIAELQIKEAETQRLIGLVPNYFVNYNRDAVPLNSKQKFELTWKTFLDPSAFVINGIIAGRGRPKTRTKASDKVRKATRNAMAPPTQTSAPVW